jgi:4-hydroxy-2-oxoheptanedioate aldolase
VVALAMIETREALDALDAILATPELDGAYIGPSDLSISLGLPPGLDRSEELAMRAIRAVLDGCRRHKVKAGIHTGSPAYAKRMIEMGFDLVTVLSDARLITLAGGEAVREMRAGKNPAASR